MFESFSAPFSLIVITVWNIVHIQLNQLCLVIAILYPPTTLRLLIGNAGYVNHIQGGRLTRRHVHHPRPVSSYPRLCNWMPGRTRLAGDYTAPHSAWPLRNTEFSIILHLSCAGKALTCCCYIVFYSSLEHCTLLIARTWGWVTLKTIFLLWHQCLIIRLILRTIFPDHFLFMSMQISPLLREWRRQCSAQFW